VVINSINPRYPTFNVTAHDSRIFFFWEDLLTSTSGLQIHDWDEAYY